jgi:hypothetical protein
MKKLFYFLIAASFLFSACNLPGSGSPSPSVATAAALTVQAALDDPSPLASPTTANNSPGASTSAASSNPFASFEDVTNCRTGPGVNYELVTQIQPGFSVEIVGYYPPSHWLVSTDAGPCWVAGEFVTPSGSVSAIPTVTAPPTPKANAPENVSLQKWDIFCDYATNEADVTLSWSDKEDETGYRVVRNDVVIAELSANTTQFKEKITLLSGQTAGYSIIAYNTAGSNSSKTIVLGC